MQIEFKVSGGVAYFPGLAAPTRIDGNALAPDEQRALKALIEAAGFFKAPARTPPKRGAADVQTYQITIEDEGRRHSVALSDPVEDPAMQRLIERLQELARK